MSTPSVSDTKLRQDVDMKAEEVSQNSKREAGDFCYEYPTITEHFHPSKYTNALASDYPDAR